MQRRETAHRLVSLDLGTPRAEFQPSPRLLSKPNPPAAYLRAHTSAALSRPKPSFSITQLSPEILKRRATTSEIPSKATNTRPTSPKNRIDAGLKFARTLLSVAGSPDFKTLMARPVSTGLLTHVERVKKNKVKIEVKENRKTNNLREINKTKGSF